LKTLQDVVDAGKTHKSLLINITILLNISLSVS
jgi:hypothetical protein